MTLQLLVILTVMIVMAISKVDKGWKYGFRSGLEERIATQLKAAGVPVKYEDPDNRISYRIPERTARYTPDFILTKKDGTRMVIESKGRLLLGDRTKHLLIKEQFPQIDLRFVFQQPTQKIVKGSKTRYCDWADKHNFKWAKGLIPQEWLDE